MAKNWRGPHVGWMQRPFLFLHPLHYCSTPVSLIPSMLPPLKKIQLVGLGALFIKLPAGSWQQSPVAHDFSAHLAYILAYTVNDVHLPSVIKCCVQEKMTARCKSWIHLVPNFSHLSHRVIAPMATRTSNMFHAKSTSFASYIYTIWPTI